MKQQRIGHGLHDRMTQWHLNTHKKRPTQRPPYEIAFGRKPHNCPYPITDELIGCDEDFELDSDFELDDEGLVDGVVDMRAPSAAPIAVLRTHSLPTVGETSSSSSSSSSSSDSDVDMPDALLDERKSQQDEIQAAVMASLDVYTVRMVSDHNSQPAVSNRMYQPDELVALRLHNIKSKKGIDKSSLRHTRVKCIVLKALDNNPHLYKLYCSYGMIAEPFSAKDMEPLAEEHRTPALSKKADALLRQLAVVTKETKAAGKVIKLLRMKDLIEICTGQGPIAVTDPVRMTLRIKASIPTARAPTPPPPPPPNTPPAPTRATKRIRNERVPHDV